MVQSTISILKLLKNRILTPQDPLNETVVGLLTASKEALVQTLFEKPAEAGGWGIDNLTIMLNSEGTFDPGRSQ